MAERTNPEASVTLRKRLMYRPARSRSLARDSAIYFLAVMPRPIPASATNMLVVLCTIPSSPSPDEPSRWPEPMAPRSVRPREITAPRSDQNAPEAKRALRLSVARPPGATFGSDLTGLGVSNVPNPCRWPRVEPRAAGPAGSEGGHPTRRASRPDCMALTPIEDQLEAGWPTGPG